MQIDGIATVLIYLGIMVVLGGFAGLSEWVYLRAQKDKEQTPKPNRQER